MHFIAHFDSKLHSKCILLHDIAFKMHCLTKYSVDIASKIAFCNIFSTSFMFCWHAFRILILQSCFLIWKKKPKYAKNRYTLHIALVSNCSGQGTQERFFVFNFMVKKNGTYDSRRRRRREPLASSSRGESQSLKCVRELLYPHADGTLLLLAQAWSGSILRYRAATLTQNQF